MIEAIDESSEDEKRMSEIQESQGASDGETDTSSVTPPKKTVKVGGVITSPGLGFLRVPEEV